MLHSQLNQNNLKKLAILNVYEKVLTVGHLDPSILTVVRSAAAHRNAAHIFDQGSTSFLPPVVAHFGMLLSGLTLVLRSSGPG